MENGPSHVVVNQEEELPLIYLTMRSLINTSIFWIV